MSDVFTSVVLVTFPSEVQYDNWLAKFKTFYNKKAIEFLSENGQISQRASRVSGDDVIRITTYGHIEIMMHMKDARNFIANGERLAVSISQKLLDIEVTKSERFKCHFSRIIGRLSSDLIALLGFQAAIPAGLIVFTSSVNDLVSAVISARAKV